MMMVSVVAEAPESYRLSRKRPFSFIALVRKSPKDSSWLAWAMCPSLSQSLGPRASASQSPSSEMGVGWGGGKTIEGQTLGPAVEKF